MLTAKGAFEKIYGVPKSEYFAGMAGGGVTTRDMPIRISEGNRREASSRWRTAARVSLPRRWWTRCASRRSGLP
jgi:hypothetical protein